MKRAIPILLIITGILGACFFGYFALQDFAMLRAAQAQFQSAAARDADLRTLFEAYARQDVHRINVFADGTWFMMSLIISALGMMGLANARGK